MLGFGSLLTAQLFPLADSVEIQTNLHHVQKFVLHRPDRFLGNGDFPSSGQNLGIAMSAL